MAEQIPSFHWTLTTLCNYRCSYCGQDKKEPYITGDKKHCSRENVAAILRYIADLPDEWRVMLLGGEPTMHPQFFAVCASVIEKHTLGLATNFSLSLERLGHLVELCRERLAFVHASLHLEFEKADAFLEKAKKFRDLKGEKTKFFVSAVVTPQNFCALQEIEKTLTAEGIELRLQRLKEKEKYTCYNKEIEEYLTAKQRPEVKLLSREKTFSTLCDAGHLYFAIDVNTNVVRCQTRQPFFRLGNIRAKTFSRRVQPMPCLSSHCTCVAPVMFQIIHLGKKARFLELIWAIFHLVIERLFLLVRQLNH